MILIIMKKKVRAQGKIIKLNLYSKNKIILAVMIKMIINSLDMLDKTYIQIGKFFMIKQILISKIWRWIKLFNLPIKPRN
jgi:hypothetical protein